MAVNSITFGNINSADYGIYISGEGVFDAPKRAVEMVNVPGRSGAIALDQGYYENITVTYPAHNYEPDMADFKQALSDFRNALASQVGYQRLSDTFHPGEYRMAVFDEGLDINPIKYNTASQFDIKFDCKPQRYLTSGETEITVSAVDTIVNPTQYASSPLLMIKGYGKVSFNGYDVVIDDALMGNVVVNPSETIPGTLYYVSSVANSAFGYIYSSLALCNSGDQIIFGKITATATLKMNYPGETITKVESLDNRLRVSYRLTSDGGCDVTLVFTIDGGNAATGSSTQTEIAYETAQLKVFISSTYVNLSQSLILRTQAVSSPSDTQKSQLQLITSAYTNLTGCSFMYEDVTINSTIPARGDPTYIDCDLGEAYMINNDNLVSLNKYVALGSDLPTLSPGENDFLSEYTISERKIIPRWWKL